MSERPDSAHSFADDLFTHRESLAGWLRARFPGLADTENLVQESISRVWRVVSERTVSSPRALLYATAHNLAVDHVRRERVVRIEAIDSMPDLSAIEDSLSPAEAAAHHQELELLTEAIQALPDRCRQVLTLRKIYGLSQKQIAAQLGIAEHTVEAQVANGMRRIAQHLGRLGLR
jgi:RNA polymerase sigma-70 factor (ECF subfamily)